jgi:hypothetical protein
VKAAVATQLTDQTALAALAQGQNDGSRGWDVAMSVAISKLTDEELLAKIATTGWFCDACVERSLVDKAVLAAVKRVTDQELLARIASNGRSDSIRIAAIQKLTDLYLLRRVARDSNFPKLRKAAADRLSTLASLK